MRIARHSWLLSVALLGACEPPAAAEFEPRGWGYAGSGDGGAASGSPQPWVLGHRGLARNHSDNPWPENTLASASQALARGADGLEIDLVKTADDVLVMFHDRLLQEAEGLAPKTDCEGPLTELTWAEVADCQVLPGDPQGSPQPLSTLDELLELGEMKLLMLDIKNDLFDSEHREAYGDYDAARTLEVLHDVIAAHDYPGYVVLGLYQDASRQRAQDLGLESCLKYHGQHGWSPEEILDRADAVQGWGVCMHHPVFEALIARGLQDRGAQSLAYISSVTITREALRDEMLRLLGLRVHALLTSRVDLALELRSELWAP